MICSYDLQHRQTGIQQTGPVTCCPQACRQHGLAPLNGYAKTLLALERPVGPCSMAMPMQKASQVLQQTQGELHGSATWMNTGTRTHQAFPSCEQTSQSRQALQSLTDMQSVYYGPLNASWLNGSCKG